MPESTEEKIQQELREKELEGHPWSNGPHAVYGVHTHPYRKLLFVVSGTITFTLHQPSVQEVSLKAGDRLDIPAKTEHSAQVGPGGVVCIEAYLPAQ